MASLFDTPDPEHHVQSLPFEAPAANRGVGIHYTDEATIMKLIEPIVVAPLRRQWEDTRAAITKLDERRARATSAAEKEKLLTKARGLYANFRSRLGRYRVLDPACGSGNFLALSLRALKELDFAVIDDARAMGLPPDDFCVGPEAVMGIEINGYAAELARLTVWITELQWEIRKGLGLTRRPILDRLDGIVRADALITSAGSEREWPQADVIIGNPPFLGGKRMRSILGDAYVERLRAVFRGRLPGFSDLICFWLEKARTQIVAGRSTRAGLVATSSIRGGTDRTVLGRIADELVIYDAWSELPWTIEGARVEVSLVCFAAAANAPPPYQLDGVPVSNINPDLTAGLNLTAARPLQQNRRVSYLGIQKTGPLDIPGDLARMWLVEPVNPNGRPNSEILKPYWNGDDVTARNRDWWIIDFPLTASEGDAAQFEAPFEHLSRASYSPGSGLPVRNFA